MQPGPSHSPSLSPLAWLLSCWSSVVGGDGRGGGGGGVLLCLLWVLVSALLDVVVVFVVVVAGAPRSRPLQKLTKLKVPGTPRSFLTASCQRLGKTKLRFRVQ